MWRRSSSNRGKGLKRVGPKVARNTWITNGRYEVHTLEFENSPSESV